MGRICGKGRSVAGSESKALVDDESGEASIVSILAFLFLFFPLFSFWFHAIG